MTTTVEERIEKALFTYVAALDLDDAPLSWPNKAFPEEGDTKPDTYVEVMHLPNKTDRLFAKGSAPHLRQGFLQLTVITPLNAGTDDATALAGAIAAQFHADQSMFEEHTKVRIQSAPYVSAGRKTDDDVSWSKMVSIPYDCFE